MRYAVKHRTWYAYSETAPVCHNLAHLAPRDTPRQRCDQFRLTVEPQPSAHQQRADYFGNLVDYFSIESSHNGLEVMAESLVEVSPAPVNDPGRSPDWQDVASRAAIFDPADLTICQLAIPTPRTATSPALREYASASFTPARPILEAVADLQRRIHAEFAFDPRATTVQTPLAELLRLRRGVCQDFAHLAAGCLRSLRLPVRYVSGYLRTIPPPGRPRLAGADASHAWVSAWCGELGWVDFDPTNDCFVSDSHVSVAWGRDYGDVSPIQGVFVGGGEHGMGVSVDVVPLDERAGVDSPPPS